MVYEYTVVVRTAVTMRYYDSGCVARSRMEAQLALMSEAERQQVVACQRDIEWLLRDEYVSCLRHVLPVTPQTLEAVAAHVEQSEGKALCMRRQVKLQFVYGAQQSFTRFIEVSVN